MTATQLDLAGMPARLFTCTPSRLTTWQDCPRRYRFTYVDRPSPPKGAPWAHNSLGASVHLALAGWWARPIEDRTPESAAALVRERWVSLGYRDDAQEERWRERAAEMVARYVAGVDPHAVPLGIERTVAMRTDRLALSGRVDRIDRRGDEVVIVDYKTGRHVLTTDDARGSLALAAYAVAAARTLRVACRRVELHHLPTGSVVAWEHTDESLQRHLRRAHEIADEAAAATVRVRDGTPVDDAFPPRPGVMCGWCDFAAHCPEGRAAGPARTPWAGLAEELAAPDLEPTD